MTPLDRNRNPHHVPTVLVANRGEIACRVFRTVKRMGLRSAAVYSEADAGAPFVRMADAAYCIGPAPAAQSYLRIGRILEAAKALRADLVHPGFGFLSEDAAFGRAVEDAGLAFVGPPPEVLAAMGSKVEAKRMAVAAGVPVLPGYGGADDDGAGQDDAALERAAKEIGYPLIVKPAAGGGGKGMAVVRSEEDLIPALASARRVAAGAFGDTKLILERYLPAARHVEVQVMADAFGNVVHLGERDCSLQRRHQKILEETPSPSVTASLRDQLTSAAVALARHVGYRNAGTCEFLVEDGGASGGGAPRVFGFIEMNARLQVEHPVTEMVTGLDLVRLQLLVAQGAPLPDEVRTARISGHAIEVRLYAEDATAGFLPASGTLHRFRIPELDGVRVDSGVDDGSVVGIHYDPMLAKVIAWAPTRLEAAQRLASALGAAELHGVTTNRDLLVRILREPDFLAGRTDTAYLERHDPAVLGAPPLDPLTLRLHAVAAALAAQASRRVAAPVLPTLPSGWRNNPSALQEIDYDCGERRIRVGYATDPFTVTVDGEPLTGARAHTITPGDVDLELDGVRRRVRVHVAGGAVHVDSALGASVLHEVERLPEPESAAPTGSLRAPMPGGVVRVLVEAGERVEAGQPLVILEAMKMEHTVHAPHAGVVAEICVHVGRQVETGTVLAVVEAET